MNLDKFAPTMAVEYQIQGPQDTKPVTRDLSLQKGAQQVADFLERKETYLFRGVMTPDVPSSPSCFGLEFLDTDNETIHRLIFQSRLG